MLVSILLVFGAAIGHATDDPVHGRNDARIGSLLKQLGSSDFATRSKASDELSRIGPPALDALRKFVAEPPSLEAKRRAELLVRDIRYRMFDGGKPVDGFQLTLRSDRDEYRADEHFIFSLEIKNTGKKDVELFEHLTWGFLQGHGPKQEPVRSLSIPSHGTIEVRQLTGVKPEPIRSPIACGPPPKGPMQLVPAGSGAEYPIAVTGLGLLNPGDYEAVVYYDHYIHVPEPKGQLISNVVRFKVRPK